MEAMRKRLNEAMKNREKIKLIFQYPSTSHAVIKSGYVKGIYQDSFIFDEVIDGLVAYSYQFLVEVKSLEKNPVENGNKKD